MEWTDRALLMSVATMEDSLVINVLTERHGRQACLLPEATRSATMLLPGCALELTQTPGDLGEPGLAVLHDVDGGLIAESEDGVSLRIMVHVRQLLEMLLEPGEPARKVFAATRRLVFSLMAEDGRWPIYFAQWEMSVLTALGCATGFDRCRPAYRHGDAIYFSPRARRAVARSEAGAFLDGLMPVPGILMGARNARITEVRQALALTGLLFEQVALPSAGNGAMPRTRKRVIDAVRELNSVPRSPTPLRARETDEDRRRRQQSTAPLMVATRVAVAKS